MQARQRLQQLQRNDHELFLSEAVQFLKGSGETPFVNVLIRILRESGGSFDKLLFDPARLSVQEAAKVVRMICRAEASYQALVLEQVKTAVERRDFGIPLEDIPRFLDVLAESIDGHRLMPLLTKFSAHSDERVRSKAVLWAGKLSKRGEGNVTLSMDPDPRVRANAVEALWGRRDEEALQVLGKAAADKHHRVAGNALYGLYCAGDIASVRQIACMVESEDPAWQLAGVWLVGKTADPRFLQLIHNSMAVATGKLRSALLKAGRTIKARKDALQQRAPLELDLVRSQRGDRGEVEIGILVSDSTRTPVPLEDLLATNFVITDGNLKVDAFRMDKRCGAEPAHIALLVPSRQDGSDTFGDQLSAGLELGLAAKRKQDYWVVERYRFEAGNAGGSSDDSSPRTKGGLNFSAQAEVLRQSQISSTVAAHESPELAIEALGQQFPLDSKRRHIVLVWDPALKDGLLVNEAWRNRLLRQGVCLHIVQTGNSSQEELGADAAICHQLNGFHVSISGTDQLPVALAKLLQALTSSLDFSFELGRIVGHPPAAKQTVQLECYSDYGYGRLCIDGNGQKTEAPKPQTDFRLP